MIQICKFWAQSYHFWCKRMVAIVPFLLH